MTMKKLLVLGILAAGVALSAVETKIAVVDMDRIFRDYYKTKIVEANLKRQADLYSDYASKLQESLKKLNDEFVVLRDESLNAVLTDAARESRRLAAQDKYRQIEQKKSELQNYNREKSAQLRDERDRERARIFDEIREAVRRYSELSGTAIVLDRAAVSLNSFPVVIYSSNSVDITGIVLSQLNAGHKPKKEDAAPNPASARSNPNDKK